MSAVARKVIRTILARLSSHPKFKRRLVDLIYRIPWMDSRLRNLAHRAAHPEAVLDVHPDQMPEESQRCMARIRARTPK